jgi:hypothetical protein
MLNPSPNSEYIKSSYGWRLKINAVASQYPTQIHLITRACSIYKVYVDGSTMKIVVMQVISRVG